MFPRQAAREVEQRLSTDHARKVWRSINILAKTEWLAAFCAGNETMTSVVKRVETYFDDNHATTPQEPNK